MIVDRAIAIERAEAQLLALWDLDCAFVDMNQEPAIPRATTPIQHAEIDFKPPGAKNHRQMAIVAHTAPVPPEIDQNGYPRVPAALHTKYNSQLGKHLMPALGRLLVALGSDGNEKLWVEQAGYHEGEWEWHPLHCTITAMTEVTRD